MNAIAKFFILCFAIVLFNSCKKDESDPERSNYIEAKINGALWSPSSVKVILLTDSTYHFRIVDFTAITGNKNITIEANDNATGSGINTGTRTYAAGSAFFNYAATGTHYYPVSGSIVISDVETSAHLLTGTFNFIVEDDDGNQVNITDGKFVKVNYSVISQ